MAASIVVTESFGSGTDSSSYSFEVDIGSASADRYVLVGILYYNPSGTSEATVSIGGGAADLLAVTTVATDKHPSYIFGKAVPTGTTVTLDITLPVSVSWITVVVAVVTGADTSAPLDTAIAENAGFPNSGNLTLQLDLDTVTDGVVFGIAGGSIVGGPSTFNWSGITDAATITLGGEATRVRGGSLNTPLNESPRSVDFVMNGADKYSPSAAVVSFAPASAAASYDLPAAAGAVTITGSPATLVLSRKLSAGEGTVSVSGSVGGLLLDRKLVADPGGVSINGDPSGLLVGRKLVADPGEVAINGVPSGLLVDRKLQADTGSVGLSESDVGLLLGRKLVADAGSVGFSGTDASLLNDRKIAAEAGSVDLTGDSASFRQVRRLVASPGAIEISGSTAGLVHGYRLVAEPGSIEVAGYAAGRTYDRAIKAEAGSIEISAPDTRIKAARILRAEGGSFAVGGEAARLLYARLLRAVSGSVIISAFGAAFKIARRLVAGAGNHTIAGLAATVYKTGAEPSDPPSDERILTILPEDRSTILLEQYRFARAAAQARWVAPMENDMVETWPSKRPDEILNYQIKWKGRLGADEILGSDWDVPAGMSMVKAEFSTSTTTIWISGGSAGETYTFLNTITTSNDNTMEQPVEITIEEA